MIWKKFGYLFFVFFYGCGTMGTPVSLKNYQDIKALPYKIKINISVVNHDKDSSWANSPFYYDNPIDGIDSEELLDIWNSILLESIPVRFDEKNPKYTFDIELYGTMRASYVTSFDGNNYHGGSIYHLTVRDSSNKNIYNNYFMIYGYWKVKGLTVKGPGVLTSTGARIPVVKLGLYDILSFICREDFLKKTTEKVERIDHILPGMVPHMPGHAVIFEYEIQVTDDLYYDNANVSAVYFRYIMGNDIEIGDLKPSPWKGGSYRQILQVAKIAQYKKWPMFPKNLDVSSLKIIVD
ncbi:hypothetical protein [Desulfocicer niacini]